MELKILSLLKIIIIKMYGILWIYFLKFKNKYVIYIYSESYKSNSVIYMYYINNHLPMTLDNSPNQENIYLDILM